MRIKMRIAVFLLIITVLMNISIAQGSKFLLNFGISMVHAETTTTFNVTSGADDGSVDKQGTTYPPNSSTIVYYDGPRVSVTKAKVGSSYQLEVGLIRFNTASIPDTAVITSAYLMLMTRWNSSIEGRDLTVEYYPFSSINSSCHTSVAGNNANAGISIKSFTPGILKSIPLSNLANISKTGYTGFRLHTSGGIPTSQEGHINFDSYEGGGSPPQLVITYETNINPTITVTSPVANSVYSELSGFNTISLEGTVTDPNAGDIITTKYNIDGGTTQTVTGTVPTSGSFTTTSISVGSLSEGSHYLNVWSEDNRGLSSTVTTIPFKVDKTKPELGTVSFTSTTSSITISGTAADAVAGPDPSPYRYTVSGYSPTSWLAATSNTEYSLSPDTQYTATFEARDAVGHIETRSESIYTQAIVPQVAVSNATSSTLDVSMSENNPASTQYQVIVNGSQYVTPEGTLTTSPVWIVPTDKKITVRGLNPLSVYTFEVKARNGDGVETALQSAVSGTTLMSPPASPANIIATATDKTITVSWDIASTATGYDIEADGSIINTGTSTTYTHTALAPGTPHTYRIRGKNGGGIGNWSTLISKSTLPSLPEVPGNLQAVPLSTTVTVTWSNAERATGYEIEVDGLQVGNGPKTSYTHTSLTPGTSHTYRVKGVNAGGKSDWSNAVTVVTLLDSTPVPTNVKATPAKNQITLSWDPVNGASGYEVEVNGVRIDNNMNTSYTHNSLQPGTEHTYRVRAKKSSTISDWSAMLVIATLTDGFGVPANIKANAEDTSVSLSWDAVTDAVGYDVEIDGIAIDNGADTSCVHISIKNDLGINANHTYRVRARSASETSEWSELLTLSTYMLASPKNLTASSSDTTITAVWDSVIGAAAYDLEIDGALLPDITGIGHTVVGLIPGTQHRLRVRAKNQDGTSNWSPVLTKSTQVNGLSAPAVFGIAKKNTVTVLWSSIEDAVGYDVEADGTVIENIVGTSYLHQSLLPGSQHSYRVRTADGSVKGDWSSLLTLITISEKPAAPTIASISAGMTSILVSWDQISGAEGYEIEVDGIVLDNGTGTSYLHNNLSPDTAHTYRVRSKNLGGYSEWSKLESKNTVSSVKEFQINCVAGDEFNLILSGANIQELEKCSFTVSYGTDDFEVLDLCALTPQPDLPEKNTTAFSITGTNIKITHYEPGKIVFTKTSAAEPFQIWSGITNSIKLKASRDGQATIKYTMN